MPRYAAVDIGSNSLRMEAAEVVPGSIPKLLASDRQVTRLGASVFRTGKVSGEAMELVCKVIGPIPNRRSCWWMSGEEAPRPCTANMGT